MKACHPHLRPGGVVINLGSSAAVNPMPAGRGVYGAAKAATQALSRVAAAEWGPDGIRVITVLPAATSPAGRAWRQANPAEYERSLSSIPLRRLGDPRRRSARWWRSCAGPRPATSPAPRSPSTAARPTCGRPARAVPVPRPQAMVRPPLTDSVCPVM